MVELASSSTARHRNSQLRSGIKADTGAGQFSKGNNRRLGCPRLSEIFLKLLVGTEDRFGMFRAGSQ